MKSELFKEEKIREILHRNLKNSSVTALLKEKLPYLAESIPSGAAIVSIGIGDGENELALLSALAGKGDREFCALEPNSRTLETAMKRLEGFASKLTPYAGSVETFSKIRDSLPSPIVACCLSNRFCSYEPSAFLAMINASLSPRDYFLMDCHLYDSTDNPGNRQLLTTQPFAEAGLSADTIEVRNALLPALTPAGRAFRERSSLLIQKDCRLTAEDGGLSLKKGEEIELGESYRYKFSQVIALLKRERFHVVRMFLSDNNDTMVVLARPLGDGYLQYSMLER